MNCAWYRPHSRPDLDATMLKNHSETSKLPGLIDSIYDAGLDPSRWTDVVAGIRNFVDGQACGLFSKDALSKYGVTHYYYGIDSAYIQAYSDTYCKFDPLTILPRYGNVVGIPDLVNYDDYRRGRFCQEWLKPQGCVDAANVVIDRSNSNCPVLMTVLPGKRMVDNELRRRLAMVIPHASRALLINKALETKQSENTALSETLDGLNAGVFLLGPGCRLIHSNAIGQRMLAEDDVLRAVGGQLIAREADVNQSLRTAFGSNREIAISDRPCAVVLTADDGECYVGYVMPLAAMTRETDRRAVKAVGALFVKKVALNSQSSSDLLARTFKLTPTERRVLVAVIEQGGVREAAQRLGIAETTTKTHLKRVFSKTGASRQADLVKLTAGFASPLLA